MSRAPILITFCAALLCGAAQGQQVQTRDKARIGGHVTNQSGDPLRRAVVRLLGRETYKQTVDANGGFRLDGVTPGSYVLLVQRVGYSAQKYGAATPLIRDCYNAEDTSPNPGDIASLRQCAARAPGTTLSLLAGGELPNLNVKLTPLGYISGRLTNQDGDPVPAWQVQAMRNVFVNGKRVLQGGAGARTDADGYYAIGNLLPGKYVLRAYNLTGNLGANLNGDRQGKSETEADRTTYYPSAADALQTTPVDVGPGAELTGMDIRLLRKPVYTIRGKMAAPPGAALGDQMLRLSAKGESATVMNSITTTVRADGTFEFHNIESGTYVIATSGVMIRLGIPTPDALSGRLEATVAGADVDVTLTAGGSGPPLAVAGTVTVEGTKPATSPNLMLIDAESGSGNGQAVPDPAGAFQFPRKFPPSKYVVTMSGMPSGVFLKSVRYGAQDAVHNLLDLTGTGGGSLDIVLSSKIATIEGKVTNAAGDNAAGVLVTVWPRMPVVAADGGAKFASTDQSGHFEVTDLGPGEYLAAAWEEIDPGLYRDTGFLSRFTAQATPFTLAEGGGKVADLKLISREQVAAEVAKLP